MSVKVSQSVWAHSRAKGAELLLLLAIADVADDEGVAYPSIATLARKIRMGERNTHYLVKKLCAAHELSVEIGAGPRGCNLFRVQTFRAANFAGVQTFQGARACAKGVQPVAPNTSLNRHNNNNDIRVVALTSSCKKPPTRPRKAPAAKIVLSEKGVFDGIMPTQASQWRTAFPAIDVASEIHRAEVWLQANPKKTKSDYARFLVNWLSRAQDRARQGGGAPPPKTLSQAAIDYRAGVDAHGNF